MRATAKRTVRVASGAKFGRWSVIDYWRRDGELVAKCECACGREAVVVAAYLRPDAKGCGKCVAFFRAAAERWARVVERCAKPEWTPLQLERFALGPFHLPSAQVIG